MKAKDTALAAHLVAALAEIPRVRKGLRAKSKYYDGFALELIAAEMSGDESQGGSHYFYVPADLAGPILDVAEKVIRERLRALGVLLTTGVRPDAR